MADDPGVHEGYRRASAWPIFVALGLAISEMGIVLGVTSLAVGGLLLFVGSIVGILQEAGYVDTPWPLMAGFAVLLVASGALLIVATSETIQLRGWAIAAAGALLLAAAGVGHVSSRRTLEI